VRPAAALITVSMTRRRSVSSRVVPSPVVPQGTTPWMPAATWRSTMRFRPAQSGVPSRKGVMIAV
jgi:hypothetical protein